MKKLLGLVFGALLSIGAVASDNTQFTCPECGKTSQLIFERYEENPEANKYEYWTSDRFNLLAKKNLNKKILMVGKFGNTFSNSDYIFFNVYNFHGNCEGCIDALYNENLIESILECKENESLVAIFGYPVLKKNSIYFQIEGIAIGEF